MNEEHLRILVESRESDEGRKRWLNLRLFDDIRLDLADADLSGIDLNGIELFRADLRRVNFSGAILTQADFTGADLSGANLEAAKLGEASLPGTRLVQANLTNADLTGANLAKANLKGANLAETHLDEANLEETKLTDTHCPAATFVKANLNAADLRQADLSYANLSEANLEQANLSRAILVSTNFAKADLIGCSVFGVAAWKVNLKGTKQSDLIISDYREPIITVDNLEVAQFIYLLLNHKKLRHALNAVTERGVLILGRFGDGGLELLQAIAAKLRELKYLPIIFDFERPENRNYTETIKTLAGLSRFVIADLSGPSVPQELYATVPHFKIPFVPIIEKGRKKFAMFVDILEYPWVLQPVVFESRAQLLEILPGKVIDPAEDKYQERQKLLEQLFS